MRIFRKAQGPKDLAVAMAGIKMGERILHVGGAHAVLFASMATKVGLTGQATAIAFDAGDAESYRVAAAREGVLVDVEVAPPGAWPFEEATFDLIVLDADRLATGLRDQERAACLGEARRVLRSGGRALAIHQRPAGLLASLFGAAPGKGAGEARTTEQALSQAGFKPVRTIAAREGLTFVEGFRGQD
jgi:ubiquinone/menaquinone biosynthesis C-methylase UbiE